MSIAQYYVTKVEPCPQCGGSGVILHPYWREYWEEFDNRLAPTKAEHYTFWRNHGYNPYSPPSEEITCHNCNGSGCIESRASLEEALRAIFPKMLGEIQQREELDLEAADAAAFAAEWEAQ
ncbi:hypothetical protein [Meiothermus sp.]|uniref:hypothetical protein n=1 Tax=Meiothermus sp. TaxID=1955249 RepID=UPI0021DBC8AA|nr:hypothetical protein [Meiothermus sp.]GIW33749.1 MAG: hypothetical protein KatS3mg072_1082 [Meiothermus sp.]